MTRANYYAVRGTTPHTPCTFVDLCALCLCLLSALLISFFLLFLHVRPTPPFRLSVTSHGLGVESNRNLSLTFLSASDRVSIIFRVTKTRRKRASTAVAVQTQQVKYQFRNTSFSETGGEIERVLQDQSRRRPYPLVGSVEPRTGRHRKHGRLERRRVRRVRRRRGVQISRPRLRRARGCRKSAGKFRGAAVAAGRRGGIGGLHRRCRLSGWCCQRALF